MPTRSGSAATRRSTASARPGPELVADLFAGGIDGTSGAVGVGEPAVNVPDIPMVDEQSVSDPRVGTPIPPVELVPVDDAVPVVRAKDDVVVVVGSGDGLVDAAAAGLVDGHELIRYTGSAGDDMAGLVEGAREIIVTDSNRARAHHWRGSQDVVGMTEDDDPDSPDVLRVDPADERLPVFGPDADAAADGRRAGGPGARPGDGLRRAVRLPPRGPRRDGRRRRPDDGVARRAIAPTRSASSSCSTSPSRSTT